MARIIANRNSKYLAGKHIRWSGRFKSIFTGGMIHWLCRTRSTWIRVPDRSLHYYRASKSLGRQSIRSSEQSIDRFKGLKIAKGLVGLSPWTIAWWHRHSEHVLTFEPRNPWIDEFYEGLKHRSMDWFWGLKIVKGSVGYLHDSAIHLWNGKGVWSKETTLKRADF